MSYDPHQVPPLFHIDVVGASTEGAPKVNVDKGDVVIALLQRLVLGQEQQTKLLAEILQQTNAVHRQRQAELGQWKQANAKLAQRCKRAAEALNRVQNEFLKSLTDEVVQSEEDLLEGEFALNEFVDRFGPRLAQLHGVLQVLSQLSWASDSSNPS